MGCTPGRVPLQQAEQDLVKGAPTLWLLLLPSPLSPTSLQAA